MGMGHGDIITYLDDLSVEVVASISFITVAPPDYILIVTYSANLAKSHEQLTARAPPLTGVRQLCCGELEDGELVLLAAKK